MAVEERTVIVLLLRYFLSFFYLYLLWDGERTSTACFLVSYIRGISSAAKLNPILRQVLWWEYRSFVFKHSCSISGNRINILESRGQECSS